MSSRPQTLSSACIATVNVDSEEIRADLVAVDRLVGRETYSEFSFGSRHTHILANATGDERDDEFWPQRGPTVLTSLGRSLPAIFGLVEETFYLDKLRWVRILTQADSLLIPHVDFIEFDRSTTRLQIPLRTTSACLHSEGDTVMHLRTGEIWLLDATVPHAAYSPQGLARVALCLDFDCPRQVITSCLRRRTEPSQPAKIIDRPPLEPEQLKVLIELGSILDRNTVRDVMRLFGMIHFRRHVHASDCFNWLIAAAGNSGNEKILRQASDYRAYCLHERSYREHFTW